MAIDYPALKAELDAGHPETGAYSLVDATATDEINALNRDTEGGITGMSNYVVRNRSRTNNGGDTTATAIYGRLYAVANGAVGADPFGHLVATQFLTMEHIHSARNFLYILGSPVDKINTMDFIDTEITAMLDILGGGAGNAGVWKLADIDAIKNLSQNVQSRANELGFVEIGKALEVADITYARTL